MNNPDRHSSCLMKSKLCRVMSKLQGCVNKIKPKISPIFENFNNLNCLNSQQSCDCDSNTSSSSKARKNKANKKTVKELNTDGGLTWCRLAYWEERSRVGHQVPVTSNAVEVFNQVPRPNPGHDSMCLESLHSLNPKPSQSTVRTREKIGLGLIINRDETGIWAHNRSNVPIFVNSPTLDVPNSRTFNVFKIPPGFSMQIFNFDLARTYQSLRDPSCYDGPFDPYSVRLSFAKGWGQNYARQYIECCPCWLEILLIPPR